MTASSNVVPAATVIQPRRGHDRADLGHPLLAAIRLDAEADGVAYVARLIDLALDGLGVPRSRVEVAPRRTAGPTPYEQLRFLGRLTIAQVAADWVLFSHLGPARAQRYVPGPWRRPYCIFLHGIEAWGADLSGDRVAAIRSARLRLANSSYTARRIAAVHPDVGLIRPCPLALHPRDDARRSGGARDAAVRGGPRSVVIIGRMSAAERYKGHDELIECWPLVMQEIPDAQLIIVGKGDDRDRLVRKASDAQLGDRVIFPGFVDDLTRDALLEDAALFAMPSRGEGFGIVYLQAMRLGTPCVGSVADAAGDIIIDGETGRLVDQGDRQALAAAIVPILRDRALRDRMGMAGRRRYEREFTFDRFRDRLGVLLGEAFGSSAEVG